MPSCTRIPTWVPYSSLSWPRGSPPASACFSSQPWRCIAVFGRKGAATRRPRLWPPARTICPDATAAWPSAAQATDVAHPKRVALSRPPQGALPCRPQQSLAGTAVSDPSGAGEQQLSGRKKPAWSGASRTVSLLHPTTLTVFGYSRSGVSGLSATLALASWPDNLSRRDSSPSPKARWPLGGGTHHRARELAPGQVPAAAQPVAVAAS
jgi:hypothetical protein